MIEDPNDPDDARVDAAIKTLSEHFDSVIIIATRFDGDEEGTMHICKRYGNWYANYGAVKEWLARAEEDTRTKQNLMSDKAYRDPDAEE